MTARYWRVTGIETYGGGDLELSELQLFALDANNNPVRVDQTATLTSSVPPIAGTLSALNDGDTSTTAQFPTGPGLSFVWDFGVGGGYDVVYPSVGSGAAVDTFLYRAIMQYSSDAINWVTSSQYGPLAWPGAFFLIPPNSSQYIVQPKLFTITSGTFQILGADVPPFSVVLSSRAVMLDIYDWGIGRITGTVREKTGISTRPLKRRVVLLDYRSNRKLREAVSDEQTGVYSFDEIDLNREYTVIALDHTGQYRAVIADRLVPEKML